MAAFLTRFLAAGLLVACVPLVAGRLGDRAAGVLLLFPAVTLCGFFVQALDRGVPSLVGTTIGALIGLPSVLIFIVTVHTAARARLPLPLVLGFGVTAWIIAATVLLSLIAETGG